ncbi:MAG: T9SS type A sorting domain-containing protein [Ignavibacteria bacterium]|nr:T9SS type A sorting domain-containing protein [Ignavibacteria bacterium]
MKKLLLITLTLLLPVFVFALKGVSAENITSALTFRFFDSKSGISVIPVNIIIYDESNNEVLKNITRNDFKESSAIIISVNPGQYKFEVRAEGYSVFFSSVCATKNKNTEHNIFLDPLHINPNLKPETIQAKHKAGYTLLLGYISDENSGKPLRNVEVSSSLTNTVSYSDINGYYELYIPSVSCDFNRYGDIKFSGPGYSINNYQYLELFPNDDIILNIKLQKGNDLIKIDERNFRRRINELKNENPGCNECNNDESNRINEKDYNSIFSSGYLTDAVVIPATIRVGRNCTGTNCTTVEYYTLETYCKYVLPAEIYGCWGALSGGANSLRAFSVAVRSYGLWYVYNPLSSTYDICDNTYCQVFGSTQNSYCNSAVDYTARYILVNSSGVIMKTEYSAENNNKGCGNGYSGTGSTWPCIYDPVCLNATPNGHGRGLCQWGTIRWATGTKVSTSSPCSLGPSHGYGTKTWQGILSHYYPSYTLTQGATALINSITPNPSAVKPCSTFAIQYNITSTGAISLMLGASIRKAGTTAWISDPAHDIKLNITSGTNNYSRSFTVPCSASLGFYDLLVALWYDKNNNNIIDASDLVVHSFPIINNAINVTNQIGITKLSDEIPEEFNLYQNYPNPFNPVTKIKFDVANSSNVKITVYDINGRIVGNLINENLSAGSFELSWNAKNFASGIYFYSIETEYFKDTKRMLLVK